MTLALYSQDAYQKSCQAQVQAVDGLTLVLDQTVFYPLGGGQPGDSGVLRLDDGTEVAIVDTRKGEDGAVLHQLAREAPLSPGSAVEVELDWDRRYRHMRMHTALHLLGALVPYGVTGGNISAHKSRLDFDMQEGVDKEALSEGLNALVAADHVVTTRWITDQELDAQPELVRTMSVQPPRGAGKVRLLEIEGVDLQPCGGTHVKSSGEIGPLRVSKVEKKGRHNRRIHVVFDQEHPA